MESDSRSLGSCRRDGFELARDAAPVQSVRARRAQTDGAAIQTKNASYFSGGNFKNVAKEVFSA